MSSWNFSFKKKRKIICKMFGLLIHFNQSIHNEVLEFNIEDKKRKEYEQS